MTKETMLVLACCCLVSHTALASGQKLASGAGAIPKGDVALSLDLGLDLPEPIFYGVRADWGLTDRFQLGVQGSVLVLINSIGLTSQYNVWKTVDERDFLSVFLNPSVIHVHTTLLAEDPEDPSNIFIIVFEPGIAYEHRFGEERRTGLYVKVGSLHLIGVAVEADFEAFFPFRDDTTSLNFGVGVQHNFGGRFSISAEPILFVPLTDRRSAGLDLRRQVGLGGRLGLSWIF